MYSYVQQNKLDYVACFYGVFSDRSLTRIIALLLFLTIGKR